MGGSARREQLAAEAAGPPSGFDASSVSSSALEDDECRENRHRGNARFGNRIQEAVRVRLAELREMFFDKLQRRRVHASIASIVAARAIAWRATRFRLVN